MADRRPMGALESAVLECVWAHPDGVTPRAVLQELEGEFAYTTVMTVLSRLWKKNLVGRERQGRAFLYRAAVSEADLAAQRMAAALGPVKDRPAALSQFVSSLSKRDERMLRDLLGQPEQP